MVTMTVTMGIPGSGKSTWARQHAHDTGAMWLSTDEIRTHNRNVIAAFAQIHESAERHLASGASVVIDACNLKRQQRYRWLRLARRHSARAVLAIIDTPHELAVARNAARPDGQRVPDSRMAYYVDNWLTARAQAQYEGWANLHVPTTERTTGASVQW